MVATTKLFYLQVYKNIKGVLEPICIGKSASTAKSGDGDFAGSIWILLQQMSSQ